MRVTALAHRYVGYVVRSPVNFDAQRIIPTRGNVLPRFRNGLPFLLVLDEICLEWREKIGVAPNESWIAFVCAAGTCVPGGV